MQVLEADPLAPSRARGLVRTTLAEWGLGTAIDTTALLVSELVTNAVKYGRGPITVSLEHVGPVLRIGVADTELDRLPQPRLAATAAIGSSSRSPRLYRADPNRASVSSVVVAGSPQHPAPPAATVVAACA